ncbi:acetyl esterase/lipase [Ereboglobus sp. PH5-5]|uniref:alpha/beta hydrolase n=1 Tax=Ereboglobus sp. PH5-5 TaxID=2940529 RepID=UPI002406BCEF|nr:alpha/beta hydrolase [Ereboglobus sp. PH5-5]MDF9833633.1 acetyl esterase/lipase [Ereboglobus sp. PH5-5]
MNIRTIAVALALILLSGAIHAASPVVVTHEKDIVYARKFGLALTIDVMQPARPNGRGILALISGGWKSSNAPVNPSNYAEFLDHGYTVFAVRHGSQPKFVISEIAQDIHRAVRFVRHNAARWNVRPDRLGITGSSAGGHLSLTIGTKGGPGDPKAKDPVDRESSAVQAVACFYPPTDFLNYGKEGFDGAGTGTLKNYMKAFGPKAETPEGRRELGRELSPIYYITEKMPPTFIVHGDADKLVPLQQSEIFIQRAAKLGAVARLHIKPGAAHGWKNKGPERALMADWFDKHLAD